MPCSWLSEWTKLTFYGPAYTTQLSFMQTFGETADVNKTSQGLEVLSSVIVKVNTNVNIFVLKSNMSQYW